MEQEVNMKLMCIAYQSSEKVGRAFLNALTKFSTKYHNNSSTKDTLDNSGKMVKMSELRKDGSQIDESPMGVDNIKAFRKFARKYGVSFAVQKNNKTTPPTYLIFFKARDGIFAQKAINEYVQYQVAKAEKKDEKGVIENLSQAKEKVSKQPKKIKNKEQIR